MRTAPSSEQKTARSRRQVCHSRCRPHGNQIESRPRPFHKSIDRASAAAAARCSARLVSVCSCRAGSNGVCQGRPRSLKSVGDFETPAELPTNTMEGLLVDQWGGGVAALLGVERAPSCVCRQPRCRAGLSRCSLLAGSDPCSRPPRSITRPAHREPASFRFEMKFLGALLALAAAAQVRPGCRVCVWGMGRALVGGSALNLDARAVAGSLLLRSLSR